LPGAAEEPAGIRDSARRPWQVGSAQELAFSSVARRAAVEATLGPHGAGIHHDLNGCDLGLADSNRRFSIADSCLSFVERLDLEGGFTAARGAELDRKSDRVEGVEAKRFGRLFGIEKLVLFGLVANMHTELGYAIEGTRRH
jgi:hypothetical protein